MGFQDKDQLLETLVKENSMTFFLSFNLLGSHFQPCPVPWAVEQGDGHLQRHGIRDLQR